MTNTLAIYLAIIVAILLLVMAAQRLRIAYPIALVLGGLMLSIIPGIPAISLDPEAVFVIFLPPLLYEAAWYTSWKDFWKWRRVIFSFAFIIVLITSLLVAGVSVMLIPGFTLALGLLLGGIVSPPDAVSATVILKHVKVPRRVSAILEGESLLNDATSLVIFRFAIIAVSTGGFVLSEAIANFVWVIFAGVGIGIIVAAMIYLLHRWLPTDVNSDIIITLLTPYVLFMIAESFHVSGVLAVVSGGLFLSSKRNSFLTHSSRLQGTSVWSVISFLLNGLVFILIGLELPVIIGNLGAVSISRAVIYGLLISMLLMFLRVVCALGASIFTTFISRYITTADSHPGWKAPLIFGWAGMRGVVSLAAALSIPIVMNDGQEFPQRNLILFITFVVILTTLVVQGLTLPALIRAIKVEDPDQYLSLEQQEKLLQKKLAARSAEFLHAKYADHIKADPAFQLLLAKFDRDISWEEGMEDRQFKRAYVHLLQEQRKWLWEWNKDINYDDEVIRKFLLLLDMEEEKLNNLND